VRHQWPKWSHAPVFEASEVVADGPGDLPGIGDSVMASTKPNDTFHGRATGRPNCTQELG
jgi:hypothetical protein